MRYSVVSLSSVLHFNPTFFPLVEIFFFNPLTSLAFSFIFSMIFSQTLGTPMNTVGLAQPRLSTRDPFITFLSAKKVVPWTTMGAWMSIIWPATWLSGRELRIRIPFWMLKFLMASLQVQMMLSWLSITPLGLP